MTTVGVCKKRPTLCKKRKKNAKSLSNLNKGRGKHRRIRKCASTATLISESAVLAAELLNEYVESQPKTKDAWTTMQQSYSRANANSASNTAVDRQREKIADAYVRISQLKQTKIRTVEETVMLLQFIFDFIHENNCSLTASVNRAYTIFQWDRGNAFDTVKRYLNSDCVIPQLKELRKRGRGAELFIQRYGDRFKVLKREHAVEILEYVRTANKSRGGMITAGRIQAHLLGKYNKLFKKATIYYCLKKRL